MLSASSGRKDEPFGARNGKRCNATTDSDPLVAAVELQDVLCSVKDIKAARLELTCRLNLEDRLCFVTLAKGTGNL
jgi:predicted ATPase